MDGDLEQSRIDAWQVCGGLLSHVHGACAQIQHQAQPQIGARSRRQFYMTSKAATELSITLDITETEAPLTSGLSDIPECAGIAPAPESLATVVWCEREVRFRIPQGKGGEVSAVLCGLFSRRRSPGPRGSPRGTPSRPGRDSPYVAHDWVVPTPDLLFRSFHRAPSTCGVAYRGGGSRRG